MQSAIRSPQLAMLRAPATRSPTRGMASSPSWAGARHRMQTATTLASAGHSRHKTSSCGSAVHGPLNAPSPALEEHVFAAATAVHGNFEGLPVSTPVARPADDSSALSEGQVCLPRWMRRLLTRRDFLHSHAIRCGRRARHVPLVLVCASTRASTSEMLTLTACP